MKKLVSVLLAAAVALSSALMMTGCEEQEYPVSIANYTIEKEPENVVVLDPITADIMAYMDFERKFAGRSKAVTQPELKAAPVVGTEENPDIDQIVRRLSEHPDDLLKIANLYVEAEKKSAEVPASLGADLIS